MAEEIEERARTTAELREARRLYDVAGLVHEHGEVDHVDSALVLHPALRILLSLLLRKHGVTGLTSLAELAEAAGSLNQKESFVAHDLREDLLLVDAAYQHATALGAAADRALARRYDRAFLRSGRLFSAVTRHLSPAGITEKKAMAYGPAALAVALAAGLGVLVGHHLPREGEASPQPQASVEPPNAPTGLVATFFDDETLTEAAFTRKDSSIEFAWGGEPPPGLDRNDHFSARWVGRLDVPANGPYTFRLSSDDGSRLFVDDRPLIDAWAVHSLESKEATVTLTQGLHPIRVEYFDGTGDAQVKLEWRGPSFDFRVAAGKDFR